MGNRGTAGSGSESVIAPDTRPCVPQDALDYPQIPDDQIVIWTGNTHLWPDARRETFYMGHRSDALRGYALFTMLPEKAMTFPDKDTAQAFLDEMNRRRPTPYHDLHVTTVAELKLLRFHADPEPDMLPSP